MCIYEWSFENVRGEVRLLKCEFIVHTKVHWSDSDYVYMYKIFCLVFFAYSEKDNISVYRAKSNRTSCASSLASTLVWCGDASITTQQWKWMEKCTSDDSEHKTDWMWKNWDIVLKLHLLSLRHVRLLIIWRCCYL